MVPEQLGGMYQSIPKGFNSPPGEIEVVGFFALGVSAVILVLRFLATFLDEMLQ
jgi:hypothetical protein